MKKDGIPILGKCHIYIYAKYNISIYKTILYNCVGVLEYSQGNQ